VQEGIDGRGHQNKDGLPKLPWRMRYHRPVKDGKVIKAEGDPDSPISHAQHKMTGTPIRAKWVCRPVGYDNEHIYLK